MPLAALLVRRALSFVLVALALAGCGFPHYEFPPTGTKADATSDGEPDASATQDAGQEGAPPDARQCTSSDDCRNASIGYLCNVEAGRCVQCISQADCSWGRYCNEIGVCAAGCSADKDCVDPTLDAPTGDPNADAAPPLTCFIAANSCVGCATDADCPPSTICELQSTRCIPGCTSDHACSHGWLCCDGQCSLGSSCSCAAGAGDCNHTLADGCETPLNTVTHCGSCTDSCSFPNMQSSCETLICETGSCIAPYLDCNMWKMDGCEVNSDTDPNHCGGCPVQCVTPHGTTSCGSGKCKPVCDNTNWAVCDSDPAGGCTIDLMNDSKNCGACGHGCRGGTCVMGKCACPDMQPLRDSTCDNASLICGPYSGTGQDECDCFCVNRRITCRTGGTPDGNGCDVMTDGGP
jgi:hypothetical protein